MIPLPIRLPMDRFRQARAGIGLRLLVFLLLITAEPSFAQVDDVRFQRLDPWDIPVQRQVDLVQCRYGFLWIIDNDGIWRYDGHTFERVNPDPSGDRIPRSWLQKGLVGGRHGVLGLYGSSNEFVLYEIAMNRATVVAVPAPERQNGEVSRIWCAIEDSEGRFLIGTEEGDVFRLDPKSLQLEMVFPPPSTLPRSETVPVTAILEDSGGTLWVGTSCGVEHVGVDQNKLEEYTASSAPPRRLPSDDIAGLALGRDGRIWVLAVDGRFGWIDTTTRRYTDCPPAMGFLQVPIAGPMRVDLRGDVWIPRGWLGGIVRWDARRECWDAHLMSGINPDHMGGVATSFASIDNSGNIWVGTNGDGLFRFTRSASRFRSCSPVTGVPSGLSSSNVLSVWKDREGTLWVGTVSNGLNYLLPTSERFISLQHDPLNHSSLPRNMVTCVRDRNREEVWVGMVGGGGISVFNKRTGLFTRSADHSQGLRNLGSDTVTALYQDRSGTMWVGHYLGLDRYDEEAGIFRPVTRWSRETLGVMGSVAYMTEDDRGHLWLAVLGRGLCRLAMKTGEMTWYRNDPNDPGSLPTNNLWCVHFDQTRRTVWVPGQGRSIARLDTSTGSFISYRLSPRIPESSPFRTHDRAKASETSPTGIVGDAGGNLWVSVGGEVIKFNPDKGTYRSYGHSDGIAVAEVRRNAFIEADDGTIYLGGSGGLTWFHPDRMPENEVVPQVVLTRLAIFGEPVPLPPLGISEIRLSHRQHTVSFEFAALEFTNPAQNQFMYKLEGAGGEWVFLGTDRRIRFANMSPGEYLLRVRASNNDGVWNNEGISIALVINPPYWETAWFRGIMLVLVAGVGTGFYRYRRSKMRRIEQLRMRIADDLHDDIGSELSAIALESDLIARRLGSGTGQRRRVQEVARAVRNAADKLRDVVWIVNPEQEKLSDLVARMSDIASTALGGIGVQCTIRSTPHAQPLAMEFKRNVLLMYKEILNNIARHARATKVTVVIEATDGVMHICVKDNGVGFDCTAVTEGRGLKSIRARAEHIGGVLTIESAPASGTSVCFKGRIIHLKD